ncbi:MAG TPA: HAMP domain-containing sensor histidine kinase [Euzebyales bacterium]|nr:HAMP domain-containing sensor histidine kinase [Euzebyales bacterium]
MRAQHPRIVGSGPQTAARQAAVLLALAGVLALVAIAVAPQPTRESDTRLLQIAAGDLGIAAIAWSLPWGRWHRYVLLVLVVPALLMLALSTWAFGGHAAGTGPFLVLVFAWAGLHHPPWVSVAITPLALAAYVVPLVITGQPAPVISSAVVLLPVALGIGLLIAAQVEHQRRDRQRIAQIERWRATLMATLAHDVRSPLTTVQLVLETLRTAGDGLTPERRAELFTSALREVRRIARLAAGLLDVERVDRSGTLRLDLTVVPLQRAVHNALSQVDDRGITVDVDPGLTVMADTERLEQMLVNLITNALHHGEPPIVVSARVADGHARIEVRDHGPGIPAAARAHLFTPFAHTDGHGSTGLGLWIVDRLAQASGGSVSFEPAEPGTRMVLTLPQPSTDTDTAAGGRAVTGGHGVAVSPVRTPTDSGRADHR